MKKEVSKYHITKRILSIILALILILSSLYQFPVKNGVNATGSVTNVGGEYYVTTDIEDGFENMDLEYDSGYKIDGVEVSNGCKVAVGPNVNFRVYEDFTFSGVRLLGDGERDTMFILFADNVTIGGTLSGTSDNVVINYSNLTMTVFNAATLASNGINSFKNGNSNSGGTIIADQVTINSDIYSDISKSKIKAKSSFVKDSRNINATVVAEETTQITSSGGTFTLQVGDCKKTITGAVDDTAYNLLDVPGISIGSYTNPLYGTAYDFLSVVSTDTAYGGTPYLEYAEEGSSVYTTEKPVEVGNYTFRVVAPADGSYREEISEEKGFSIDYLPLSDCVKTSGDSYVTMEGLSNDIYVKDEVTLKPASGYKIKTYGGSSFSDSISLNWDDLYVGESFNTDTCFYLKRNSDEAETSFQNYELIAPELKNLIFDYVDPVIDSIVVDGVSKSFGEGEVVRAEKIEITISDTNLDKVITPDAEYTRENGGVTAVGSTYKSTVVFKGIIGQPQDTYFMAFDKVGREISLGFTLKYPLITPNSSVSVSDVYVGTEIEPVLTTDSDGRSGAVFKYKSSSDTEYTSEKPTAAGTYNVLAVIPETDIYKEGSCESDFRIMKKTPSVAEIIVPDSVIGKEYEAVLTTDSDGKNQAVIEYRKETEDDSAFVTEKPKASGKYIVRATIPETDTFEMVQCTSTFTINKRSTGENKVEVPDTIIGTDYIPVLTTISDGKDKAVFEYKKESEDDSKYVTEKPTKAGKYMVRATVPATDYYDKIVCTATFTISKKTASILKVEVGKIYAGQDYEPVLTTDSDGKDKASFVYKDRSKSGDNYIKDKPKAAGNYTVKAIIPATDTYEAASCTVDYRIYKNEVSAKISIDDVIAGTAYEPKLNTLSDGAKKAVFEYKLKKAPEEAYTKTQPKTVGEYVVRAKIPETAKYEPITCKAEFRIVYLDTPDEPYTLTGTKGKNDYYVSDVYLKAASGYSISKNLMGTYMSLLGFNNDISNVFLMRNKDGALTSSVPVTEKVKIDKNVPVFMDVKSPLGDIASLTKGGVVYSDQMVVRVIDEHLAGIKMNGVMISPEDSNADIVLDSENGIKYIQMIAEDEAGNENRLEFTLKAEWLKEKKIPAGKLIPLEAEEEYFLESGNWTMDGDPTVYDGGGSVYVDNNGSFTFEVN